MTVVEMPEGGPDLGLGCPTCAAERREGHTSRGDPTFTFWCVRPQVGGGLGLWSVGGEAAAGGKGISSETKCAFTLLVCQCPVWEGVVASERKRPQLLLLPSLRCLLSHAVVGAGGSRKTGAVVRELMDKELGVMLEEPTVWGNCCAPSQRASWDVRGGKATSRMILSALPGPWANLTLADALQGLPECFSAHLMIWEGLPRCSMVKNAPANAGGVGSSPGSGRSPGGGDGNPL